MNTTDSDAPAKNDWSDWRTELEHQLAAVVDNDRVTLDRDDAVVLRASLDGVLDVLGAMHKGVVFALVTFLAGSTISFALRALSPDTAHPGVAWGLAALCLLFAWYQYSRVRRRSKDRYEFVFEPDSVTVRRSSKNAPELEVTVAPGDSVDVLSPNSSCLAVGSDLVSIGLPFDRDDALVLADVMRSHLGSPARRELEKEDGAELETGEWDADIHRIRIEDSVIEVIPIPYRKSALGQAKLATCWIVILFFGAVAAFSFHTDQSGAGIGLIGATLIGLAILLRYVARRVSWRADLSTGRLYKTVTWIFGREDTTRIDIDPDMNVRLKKGESGKYSYAVELDARDFTETLIENDNLAVVRLLALNLSEGFGLYFVDELDDNGA